jgi:hypothetical protein
MAKRRILVTWVGHADLRAVAAGRPHEEREILLKAIASGPPPADQIGPIRTLLQAESFDEVHLLCNYPEDAVRIFAGALEQQVNSTIFRTPPFAITPETPGWRQHASKWSRTSSPWLPCCGSWGERFLNPSRKSSPATSPLSQRVLARSPLDS